MPNYARENDERSGEIDGEYCRNCNSTVTLNFWRPA